MMTASGSPAAGMPASGVFDKRPRWLVACLLLLFLTAGAIRLYRLHAPGVLIDREYTSAVFARSFYFQMSGADEPWHEEIAVLTRQNQPILEPPVTEFMVSLIYLVSGGERLWAAHVLTSLFWLAGGVFFYRAARLLLPAEGALVALVYYLFVPMGILISRSFQPDSLMMMLFMISIFCIVRHFDMPGRKGLLFAAGLSGLAILYRPLIVFGLLGMFSALTIQRRGRWQDLFGKDFIIYSTISLLPAFLYYGYGTFVAGYLGWKYSSSFRPGLFRYREYWIGWLDLAVTGAGYLAMIAGLFGFALARGKARAVLIGLWSGYLVFGLLFNMHIHTHAYYHAQLIPAVALSLGILTTAIRDQVGRQALARFWYLPVLAALALIAFLNVRTVRSSIGWPRIKSLQTAQEGGEIVGHSSRTVYLSRYYGMPLQYYGELTGTYWPRRTGLRAYMNMDVEDLSIQERIDDLGFAPEYFAITDMAEYNRNHQDLDAFLKENCTLIADSSTYLIYDGSCARPTDQ